MRYTSNKKYGTSCLLFENGSFVDFEIGNESVGAILKRVLTSMLTLVVNVRMPLFMLIAASYSPA